MREWTDQGRHPMADSEQAARHPVRTPAQRRIRRRWAIAGGVVLCWLLAYGVTGSAAAAVVVLVAMAAIGVACVAGMRALGITRDHPWLQRIAARPWRDGQDVLQVAMRHLPEVFIVTPNGAVLAPDLVELQMNPGDLASLGELMGLDVVSSSLTDVYAAHVTKSGARFAGSWEPEVYIVPDHSIPQGRYRLRRGLPVGARSSAGPWDLPAEPDLVDRQFTRVDAAAVDPGLTVMDGMATVMEQIRPAVPVLRLVTGSSVAETSISGARAGRGPVELELPYAPTVSRVHARFTFSEGCWRVTNEGMNGLAINGVPVSGEQPLGDGDSIRWGSRPDAPMSRIEIG